MCVWVCLCVCLCICEVVEVVELVVVATADIYKPREFFQILINRGEPHQGKDSGGLRGTRLDLSV